MRISDWSSDVCPSDLGGIGVSKDPTQVSCASIRTDANVTDFQLPSPDADALAHSARLDALIDAQIDAADGAAIPFSRLMERSEEGRVGKGSVSPGKCRWWRDNKNKKPKDINSK